MENLTTIRQQIDRELDRLPPESLAQILTVIRSLPAPRDYRDLWANWFAEVEQLPRDRPPINPTSEPPSYTDHLVEKYRAQGLNL